MSAWIKEINIDVIDHRQPQILANYAQVLNHIQTSSMYNDKALAEWADGSRADAWIVATAITLNHTVVTFEQPNRSLGTHVSAHPKIPDVCAQFHVKCSSLYDMS